ncbi:MAG: hypothetical protein QXP70_06225, partial [Methanomassiliicoccales archaeon]
ECIGLLYGTGAQSRGNAFYTIHSAIPLPSIANENHVSVDKGGYVTEYRPPETMRIVGWYHSHLGAGCFMSPVDVETHRKWFGGGGVAIVFDTVSKVMGAFAFNRSDLVRLEIRVL